MEDRKILVEVTKEELELLQNGFKEPKNEEDEQPANLIKRLLNKLDSIPSTTKEMGFDVVTREETQIKYYEFSNFKIIVYLVHQEQYGCKPRIVIEYK